MEPRELKVGEIVQLDPEASGNPMFGATLMIVTVPKPWGAQGYVQSLGENGERGGRAYYRAKWEEMEPTGGMAVWLPASDIPEETAPDA